MRNNILTVTYAFFFSGWWGWDGEGRENMAVEGTADGRPRDQSLLTSRETAWKPESERTGGNAWGNMIDVRQGQREVRSGDYAQGSLRTTGA